MKEIARFQDKDFEEFDAKKEKLIRHLEKKKISMKRRHRQEEFELEREFYAKQNQLFMEYTPNFSDSEAAAATKPNYTTAGGGAVFMICYNRDFDAPYVYEIYSISFQCFGRLSSSRYASSPPSMPRPVKQLKRKSYPFSMGFFSVGSKIYMVGGEMLTRPEQTTGIQACNGVYVYDAVTNSVMPGPSMLKPKVKPFVMGPIEGKFYVHGISLQSHNFELFDPELEQWFELPHAPVQSNVQLTEDYNIVAYVVIDHTILLSTTSGEGFSFNISTRSWDEGTCSDLPSQLGPAVLGQFYGLVEIGPSQFPIFSNFRVERDRYDQSFNFFEDAPVENLPNPGIHVRYGHQGYVAYFGNQHFCLVRSGYDGCPYDDDIPPNYHVSIDLFRMESESRCSSRSGRVKSRHRRFFAVDHHSLSYIMDDNHGEDFRRTVCFATPTI